MLGAIAGDIIGSVYEQSPIKHMEFPLFRDDCFYTDDTVLTVALADSLMSGVPYVENLKKFWRLYPNSEYGPRFYRWARSKDSEPYNSYGNGSAMRVSPVGYMYNSLDEVLAEAKRSAEVTHNHPEGVQGAQATAAVIFLARNGACVEELWDYVRSNFNYDVDTSLDEIRPGYRYDITCQGTMPVAIRALLESVSYEDAVRKAVGMGGDSDTLGCITGSMAQALYGGIPDAIADRALTFLPDPMQEIVVRFCRKHGC